MTRKAPHAITLEKPYRKNVPYEDPTRQVIGPEKVNVHMIKCLRVGFRCHVIFRANTRKIYVRK